MQQRFVSFCLFLCALLAFAPSANASVLSYVSDLLSTSAPSFGAAHRIQFTLVQTVPPSGSITIVPEGAFVIPAGFDASDVSFFVATSGPYVARPLAALPSSSEDGVSVVSGATPSLTFTLNATDGLPSGAAVRIVLASTTAPAYDPVNPDSLGSYRIRINTANPASVPLDHGTAMIAIVSQVTTSLAAVQHAPTRDNGEPSGTIAANNPFIEISLTTDELSTCHYATTTGVSYASMTGTFTPNIGDVFYTDLTGFQNNTSYAFYVRCKSTQGLQNSDDYPILFKLNPDPVSNTSIPSGDTSGGGGSGPYVGGSQVLYLGAVVFKGFTSPSGAVTILRDGVTAGSARAASDGSFSTTVSNLERGTYTFGIYTTDAQGRKTSAASQTLTVGQGSTNTVSGVLVPPSIALAHDTVPVGTDALVSGESLPNAHIEVSTVAASGATHTYTASSSPSTGGWSVTIPGSDLAEGTYQVKARTIQSADSTSDFSTPLFLTVGQATGPSGPGNPDLNGDGKVNLTDFSILLSDWNATSGPADLNGDGIVNLADLSIMLFNWTG